MRKIVTILFLLITCNSFAAIKTYYFSAAGNDANTGLSSGSPYKTIAKLNTLTLAPGDQVLFNRGDVFYGSITIHNSGSSGTPIVFGAYGTGANPVISGFSNVVTWTNLGSNIWESTFAVSTLSSANMVLINGVNVPMGRYPNTGYLTYQSASGTSSITSSGLVGSWTGAEAVIRKNNYVTNRCPITSQSGSTLNYTSPDGINATAGYGFYIQNDARTLDAQNEWYYNPSTKKIRIYSTSQPSNVQVSTKDTLVTIIGVLHDITFDGLTFEGSNKDAFTIRSAQNITIQNCTIDYSGKDAVWGGQNGGAASTNFVFQNNIVNHTNNLGIVLESEFAGALISGNVFKNTGLNDGMGGDGSGNYGTLMGIEVFAQGAIIENNIVDSVGYDGIDFQKNNVIVRNNFVSNHCSQKMDGGGIYTVVGNGNPVFTGQQILNNIVINGLGSNAGTANTGNPAVHGIYLDDFAANVTVTGNTCMNNQYSGIFLHSAKNCDIQHNTLYNNGEEQLLIGSFESTAPTTGLTIKNNKLIGKTSTQRAASFESLANDISNFGILDSNYYCRPIADNNTVIHVAINGYTTNSDYSLPMWQTYIGQDAASKKSPLTITNVNQLFDYVVDKDSTVSIITGKDMAGTDYTGTTALPAYSSLVLIQTASLIPVDISWTPAPLTYGQGLGSGQLNAIATASGNPVTGTHIYTPGSGTILNAGTPTLQDNFTPADQSTYATAVKTTPVIVNQDTATLSWLHLTDLVYNGQQQAPLVITNPAGLQTTQVLLNNVVSSEVNAGNYSAIGALNNSNFKSTAITGTFIINKKTLVISCHSDTFNYDGNNHFILASNSDNVPMIYSYPDGTPIAAGTYRQVVSMNQQNYQATPDTVTITIVTNSAIIFISDTLKTFTGSAQGVTVTSAYSHSETYNGSATIPTAAGTYTVITHITDGIHTGADTANLVIAKRAAVLTWPTPAKLDENVPIDATRLTASADIPGTGVYNYPIGTKFTQGTYILTWTFTPTDTANNIGGTISVTLIVKGSPFQNFILSNSIYESIK